MERVGPQPAGENVSNEKDANCPYEGLFKGFGLGGKPDPPISHTMVRVHPQHNKSTLSFGEEKSPRERFEFTEQQRHQKPIETSFYIEQAAAANKHVDRNKSSIVMGDDGPPFVYPEHKEHLWMAQPTVDPHYTRHTHNQHNKSSLVFGDAADSERYAYAQERRGQGTFGQRGQEELLFAAVAEKEKQAANRNRRNDSTFVLGTDVVDVPPGTLKNFSTQCGVSTPSYSSVLIQNRKNNSASTCES